MISDLKCPNCGGIVGRDGARRLACPLCDVPGVNGVCQRCESVVPANLMTSWHGDGHAESVCLPCAKAAADGERSVLACAG